MDNFGNKLLTYKLICIFYKADYTLIFPTHTENTITKINMFIHYII